jgi:hypothetical protein
MDSEGIRGFLQGGWPDVLTYDGDDIDFTTATGIQYSTIVRQLLSSTTASAPSLAKVLGTGPQTEISAATKYHSTLNTKSIALGFGRRHASPQSSSAAVTMHPNSFNPFTIAACAVTHDY